MVHNPDLSAGSRISPSACDAGGSEPYWEIEDTGPAEVWWRTPESRPDFRKFNPSAPAFP